MELHVAFLPEEVGPVRGRTIVVIDVIRATTSVLAMLERGCAEVLIAPEVEAARRYREAHPQVLLAGEQGGVAPPGFDFGNSPPAFAGADLAGRRVVFATTNGTRAIRLTREASVVLLGCLRNRSAAAREAVAAAEGPGITLVCAGREGRFSLDDAYTAGAIVDAAVAIPSAHGPIDLTDAARAAHALYQSNADAAMVFRQTRAGQNVIAIDLPGDLDYCAEQDRSVLVPRLGERVRVVAP